MCTYYSILEPFFLLEKLIQTQMLLTELTACECEYTVERMIYWAGFRTTKYTSIVKILQFE